MKRRKPSNETSCASRAHVTHLTDPNDGTPLVLVPLAGAERRSALIERADYERLVTELGISPLWTLNGQVRVALNGTASGNLIGVARIMLGAGPRQYIRHLNSDRTDLRRKNLALRRGGCARRCDLALVKKRAARVTIKPAVRLAA
jgi:hypothetical protein